MSRPASQSSDEVTFKPFSRKQRKELEGYVATSIFVLRALLFAGQYLDRLKAKGFPWTAFDIKPSGRRPSFTWEEAKAFGVLDRNYRFLDVEFEAIRRETLVK
jgi:hypothetical protein